MKDFVIISAELNTVSKAQNKAATKLLKDWLVEHNYAFKQVIGCYMGASETSFVVCTPTPREVLNLVRKAALFDQECILHVDGLSNACLVNSEGSTPIGKFNEVSGKPETDAWTFDPQTGTYYVVS